MNTYKLYAGSPENSHVAFVTHPRLKLYNAKVLQRWFMRCLTEAGRRKRKKDLVHFRATLKQARAQQEPAFARIFSRLIRKPDIRVEQVFDDAVDLFCHEHGFAQIKPTQVIPVGAWDTCYPAHRRFGT